MCALTLSATVVVLMLASPALSANPPGKVILETGCPSSVPVMNTNFCHSPVAVRLIVSGDVGTATLGHSSADMPPPRAIYGRVTGQPAALSGVTYRVIFSYQCWVLHKASQAFVRSGNPRQFSADSAGTWKLPIPPHTAYCFVSGEVGVEKGTAVRLEIRAVQ